MTVQELLNSVKEKMTVDDVLQLVEQISELSNCTEAEALEKLQEARKAVAA